MKNIILPICLAMLGLTACKTEVEKDSKATITSEDTTAVAETDTITEKPRDSVADAKAWENYMSPGEAHKMLAQENGTWTCEMSIWMEPDSKPEKAVVTAEARMIMGGRYQEMLFKGNMAGMPFEGKGTVGFNKVNNEYTSTWIDNMGTGMMVSKGAYDETAKAINFKGEMINPADGKLTAYREVYTIVDPNTRKMEMFDTKNGREFKSMEILMKRK